MTQLYKRTIFIFAILLFSSMLPTRLLGQAADFTASTTSTCVGGTVIFTDLSTGVTPTTSYVWSFGTGANPSTASGEGPHAVTYNTPGAKTVSLTLTDGSITNTKTRTNYITVGQPNTITLTSGASTNIQTVCLNAALAPTITYATTGATGANFTDLPPGVTGNWNANVVTISGNPSAVGNYNFTITLTGGCGTTTANGSITVNPIPTPILVSSDADNTFCAGTSVTFTAGGGTDFTFRVNGVSKQTGAGPVYTTNTLLNGQVVDVIVISSTGCTATSAGITNTVNDLPNPSIAGPQAICGLPTTAFYSVVDHAGHTYNWTATGGVVSSGQGTSVITADWSTVGSGTVNLVETITATGCTNSNSINVTKAPASVGGTLSGTKTVCEGSTSGAMTLNGYVGDILKWQYSDDLTNWVDTAYTATSFMSWPLTETTYFRVIVQSGACAVVASTTATITVNPTPNLVINQPASVCEPSNIDLTAPAITAGSDAGLTLSYWTNAQATIPYATPAAAVSGTYYIRGESASGCATIKPVTVVVSPKPNLLITPNANPVCVNEGLSLKLTGQEGSVWNWLNPDTTNVNPVLLFPAVGTHTFSARATNLAGCVDTTSLIVTVLAQPVVTITTTGGNNACVGQTKTYNATPNPNFTYQWFVNDVLSPAATTAAFNHVITGNQAVEIKVKATNTLTSCYVYDSLNVNPIQSPVLVMEASKLQLCQGDQTYITLSSPSTPPVYFAWGDGLQGNVLTRGFIPTQDTTIWAEAINSTGCITRDTVDILVRDTLAFTISASNNGAVVCTGNEVTFAGPSGVGYTYQWYVNGVAIANATAQTFIRSFSQNSAVRLIVNDAAVGCSGSATVAITVKNAPVVDLGIDQQVCENYFVTLSGPTGTGYTYAWFKNAEAATMATTREINYKVTAGTTLLRLEVTSPEGCTSSDQLNILSKAVPVINLAANDSELCVGENIILSLTTSGASGTVWWDNITGINPRIFVPGIGDSTYVFWAQAANGLGCTARDSVEVKVNPLPVVNISTPGGNNSVCINSTAVVNGPVVAGHQYQWYLNGGVAGTNNAQFSFPMLDDARVSLRVTDAKGCTAESLPLDLLVIDLPGIILHQDKNEICLGEAVQLTINQQNISSFVWQDGLGGNIPSRSFIPASTGTFAFSASGVHNVTSCVSFDTAFVVVHALPVAHINTPALTTICQGQSVTLSTTTLANHQYMWMIEGDSVGSGATYVFNGMLTKTITLQVKNLNGCIETDEITIQVEEAPQVDLGGNRMVCKNYVLDLQGPENDNYTYKWFVNGNQIANNTFAYSFVVTQPVTIRLEAKVGNCTMADQITVTPLEVPVINVTADNAAICHGDTLALQLSTQNASSYVWWDGFTGLTQRFYVPVENDTTIALWAEAINGLGCRSRDSVLVRINPLPEVPLTVSGGSNTVCYMATATVSGPQKAGHHYQWFVDGVAQGTDNYQYSFIVTKDVAVKLRITDANGCVNSNQITVLSRNLPGIVLNPDSLEVCTGESFTLTINDQNISAYAWFDGLAGNLKQRTFEATTAGIYRYWAEGTNSFGCISRDTTVVTVNNPPPVNIISSNGTQVCAGTSVTLTGTGQEEDEFAWYVAGELVNNTSTYVFEATQTVLVTLVVTSPSGCSGSKEITIEVLPTPQPNLGPDRQVCEGYTVLFSAPLAVGNTFGWYLNNTLVSDDSVYSVTVQNAFNLRLVVTSANGCTNTDEVSITPLASPQIQLNPQTSEFCLGETAVLSLTTNGTSFIWWDGLGTNVATRSFTPQTGDSTYAYWAEAINVLGCTRRDTAFVTVNNHPEIDISIAGVTNTFCQGSNATVVGPAVDGYSYQWYVNGMPTGGNNDRLIFPVMEESLVKLEVTDANGCFGADSLTVFTHNEPGIVLNPDSLDVCFGDSFTLTINPANVVSFAWWDGLAGNLTSRTIVPTTPDITYVYWAQGINSIGCISYDTAYIYVHSLPQAIILTPVGTNICEGGTMLLQTPSIEGYTYEWTINGELVSTETEIEFIAQSSVTVSLQVFNQYNCSTTSSVEIIVNDTPHITLGNDMEVCKGETVSLNGPAGTGYTYAWYYNGQPTGVNTPSFEFVVGELAEVRLDMNTVNGCVASDTINISPLVSPKVTISTSLPEVCTGQAVTLTASLVDAVAFAWWDGYTNPTRTLVPENVGVNDFWAEAVSAANCVSRDSAEVLVHPNPAMLLSISQGSPNVCEGTAVTFAAANVGETVIDYVVWDKVLTEPMGTQTVLYHETTFNQSRWFHAKMVSTLGCAVSDSLYIAVEALPEMTISNDTTLCAGADITLSATGGSFCIWSDETGIIGGGYSFDIIADESKTYYATVFSDSNLGCFSIDSVTVTVEPKPTVTIQASQQNVCGGTPVVLSATGADAYVWSTGQTSQLITVAPLQTTVYSVTGINQYGCTAQATFTLNMIPAPEVSLSGLDPRYCSNADPVVLTGTPVGGIFSGGSGLVGGKFYPALAGGGQHQIMYSFVNSFGCTGYDTLSTVVVVVPDTINLGEAVAICPHEQVTFDAGPGYEQYFWSTSDITQTATIKGNAYFAGTTRTITVIAVVQECSVSGSVELTIRNDCYIGLDENDKTTDFVLVPNPTTGEFVIKHNGEPGTIEVSIFDGRAAGVYSGRFDSCFEDGQSCRINLSHLPKGVYMVSIVKDNRQYMRKLVVM